MIITSIHIISNYTKPESFYGSPLMVGWTYCPLSMLDGRPGAASASELSNNGKERAVWREKIDNSHY